MQCQILRIMLLVLALVPLTAAAQDRFALVIGNGKYTSIGSLRNPTNDVRLISQSLEQVGFEVTLLIDADRRQMISSARDLANKLDEVGEHAVGLFYYAGHGVSYGGQNWLIPVGADVASGSDIEFNTVSASYMLDLLEQARNKTDILFLDACRDNPFDLPAGTRSLSRGIAKMNPKGSYVAYSTTEGQVAYDGEGQYSPFAEALAAEIRTPGISIGDMMIEVRARVQEATKDRGEVKQVPWSATSMAGRFDFNPVTATVAEPQPAVQANLRPDPQPTSSKSAEEILWDRVQLANTIDDYDFYLKQYPKGVYLKLAKYERKKLRKAEKKSAAASAKNDNTGSNIFAGALGALVGNSSKKSVPTDDPQEKEPINIFTDALDVMAGGATESTQRNVGGNAGGQNAYQPAVQTAVWFGDDFVQWQVSTNGTNFNASTVYPGLGPITFRGQFQGTAVNYGIYDAAGQQIGYGQGAYSDQQHMPVTNYWMNGQFMSAGRFHISHAPN